MMTARTNRTPRGYVADELGPLRHAALDTPPRASKTGSTFFALCGTTVAVVLDPAGFDVRHPRACTACVVQARPRLAREAGRR